MWALIHIIHMEFLSQKSKDKLFVLSLALFAILFMTALAYGASFLHKKITIYRFKMDPGVCVRDSSGVYYKVVRIQGDHYDLLVVEGNKIKKVKREIAQFHVVEDPDKVDCRDPSKSKRKKRVTDSKL